MSDKESEEVLLDSISLQVAAQVIKHISAGLYRSPGSSIKELISNSFDACATEVNVDFYLGTFKSTQFEFEKIVIRDNGAGMTLDTLYEVFTHIGSSGKDKPSTSENPDCKLRPIIGRMGIGMLSVASACTGFVVRTKKRGEQKEYTAKISLSFFKDRIQRSESMDKSKLGNVELYSRDVNNDESYTEIEISEFTPPFLENIVPTLSTSYLYNYIRGKESYEEYFELFVYNVQQQGKLANVAVIDKLIADVGTMAPVEYLPDGPVRKIIKLNGKEYQIPGTDTKEYDQLRNKPKSFNFNVIANIYVKGLDGRSRLRNSFKIYKPFIYPVLEDVTDSVDFEDLDPYVYLLPPRDDKVLNDDGVYEETSVRGYYYHQNKRIQPSEFSGLLYRVFNVALGNEFGDPMKFFVDAYLVFQQSFVEVYLDKGFQQIVNLDREGLFEGSNMYRYLRNYLVNTIRGDAPPKPAPSKPETSKEEQEKQFQQDQNQTFKDNKRDAIVPKVKRRRSNTRKAKIEKRSEQVEQRLLDDFGAQILTKERTDEVKEMRVEIEGDELIAYIPKFQKRKELWDLLCIGVIANTRDDNKIKEKLVKFILDLYEEVEVGK
ncbi:MAG: ATP-binding protein [Thermoplasmatales archaeon]|jgi:hypothetical protein|nr:ATP-binding protein [Thermoplasmatales archaeon]